jgi:uncharacterized protein (DUF486 family)
MQLYVVPAMLLLSSLLMAFAWLGHIRFRRRSYFAALALSWLLVLPEYLLNISAIRWGHGTFLGGEMAAMNLCSGVFCVALVSRFFLKEKITPRQLLGFLMLAGGVVLVVVK